MDSVKEENKSYREIIQQSYFWDLLIFLIRSKLIYLEETPVLYKISGNKYQNEFKTVEKYARENELGLWSECY